MDEEDRPHYEELLRKLNAVDPWLARIGSEDASSRPPARSDLYVDNERTHPFETSDTAWHSLSHAVDHLHCLRTLLHDAQLIHMYAPFSLVRAALENASAAVWMLHPDDRTERIARRLRFAAWNIRNTEQARQLLKAPAASRTEEDWLKRVRDVATDAGVDPDVALRKGFSYRGIINAASEVLDKGSPAVPFAWKLCSAISHGDWWPTLLDAGRTEVPGAAPDVARLNVTANVKNLMYVAGFAVHMTMAGWRLFDERSTAPY